MDDKRLLRYWTNELGWGWGHQSQLVFSFLQEAAAFAEGGTILDAGAGHQRYKPFFAHCHYLAQEHPSGIEFKQMQGISYDLISPLDERIPLADGSLDAIINTSVIEHVRYPERFFSEAFRVLEPGGRIFIHVPFAYPEHEIPYDFQRPTRYGLIRWLEDAGFLEVSVAPTTSSTEASLAFVRSSVEQDLFRDTPITKGGVASKAIAWAKSEPFRFSWHATLWVVIVSLTKLLSLIATRFVDKGPADSTTFPVGWIATATKPGTLRRKRYNSRDEFLRICGTP